MNKKQLVGGSAVALVLLVIIGAIAGSPSEKNHITTNTNASAATPAAAVLPTEGPPILGLILAS